ncbi:hypothetical protein BDR07DRAFT_1471196 [Suillus spraguei]|nr:hypothetical protein BDR07DRAFT_1471196 [Suillus spraguei]
MAVMTRRLQFFNGTNLVQEDEARLAAFGDYSTNGRRAHVPLANIYTSYIVQVGIGIPTTIYNLIVDTGSAITWVGASTRYEPTSTSFNTRQPMGQTYGGYSHGMLWTDTTTFVDGLTIKRMPIGVASTSHGISADDTTLGTLQNSPRETIQTVTDLLYIQGIISQPLVGIFFYFGEIDPTMRISNVAYTPITTTRLSARYWGINQRITYGSTEILSSTAGVVDCGSTFFWIASGYGALQALKFHIGGETYSLIPNAQILPRSLITKSRDDADVIHLVVEQIDRPTGAGLDFLNSYVCASTLCSIAATPAAMVWLCWEQLAYAGN